MEVLLEVSLLSNVVATLRQRFCPLCVSHKYKRMPKRRQSRPRFSGFSLLVVQLLGKRFFSWKDSLRGLGNRASIGFVQERNPHGRQSLCRSINASPPRRPDASSEPTREPRHTRRTLRQVTCRIRSLFREGRRSAAALSKEVECHSPLRPQSLQIPGYASWEL